MLGFTVIATASSRNADYVRSLGAAHVLDYNDPNILTQIKELTSGRLRYAYDCIGPASAQQCYEVLDKSGGAQLATIAGLPEAKTKPELHPESASINIHRVLLEAVYDDPVLLNFMKNTIPVIEKLLEQGKLKPNRITVLQGGLQGILEGHELMLANKVSAD